MLAPHKTRHKSPNVGREKSLLMDMGLRLRFSFALF
jgi:hypothetical protein